jgi:putative GTP pyrophosphokinase
MLLTKSGIDRLGLRLKGLEPNDEDLKALDAYRKSFESSYESVVTAIRRDLKLEPTGRPAKSTTSVIDTLRRESIRLSQMQDIAGCRLIVRNVLEQDRVVRRLRRQFPGSVLIDRRKKPSHGYRAAHVVVTLAGKPIEIQVRSRLQHLWAELSEKLSDSVGTALKYGGGPADVRSRLAATSTSVAAFEEAEKAANELRRLPSATIPNLSKLRERLKVLRRENIRLLGRLSSLSDIIEKKR